MCAHTYIHTCMYIYKHPCKISKIRIPMYLYNSQDSQYLQRKHECTNIIKRYCVHYTYNYISISFILQLSQKTDVDIDVHMQIPRMSTKINN